MSEIQGFRLPDTREDEIPDGIGIGAYWKVLWPDSSGLPKTVISPGKLTEDCWRLVVPLGGGFGIANLDNHTVREHEDGTISVLPNDGSSNSILVSKSANGPSWHGFVYAGVLREG